MQQEFIMVKKLVLSVVVSMIFIGCSRKKDDVNAEFNKPADYWYSKMIKYIKRSDLDNRLNNLFTYDGDSFYGICFALGSNEFLGSNCNY